MPFSGGCAVRPVKIINKRGACVSRLRVSCIALTRKPDLDNANVGNISQESMETAIYRWYAAVFLFYRKYEGIHGMKAT